MDSFRIALFRTLALAALFLPLPAGGVDADALISLLSESNKLSQLNQQMDELNNAKTSIGGMPDKEFRKRQHELKSEITKENRRINSLRNDCKALAKKGDINARDNQGRTLLMLAASSGSDKAVEMILEESPDLEIKDKANRRAVDYEIEGGGMAITAYLDENWVKAVQEGDAETAAKLIDCGANMETLVYGEPALAVALRENKETLFNFLINVLPRINGRTKEGYTILELAIRQADANALRSLLRKGADDGSKLSSGITPLFLLTTVGDAECFKVYVENSSQVDKDLVPAMTARIGSADKIKQVVHNAEEANREDTRGNIPMHEAARRGDPEIFCMLLELGGSRTVKNKRGETTLMHAALSGNLATLTLAMEGLQQGDLEAKDGKGWNAADYAKSSRNNALLEKLSAAGIKPAK